MDRRPSSSRFRERHHAPRRSAAQVQSDGSGAKDDRAPHGSRPQLIAQTHQLRPHPGTENGEYDVSHVTRTSFGLVPDARSAHGCVSELHSPDVPLPVTIESRTLMPRMVLPLPTYFPPATPYRPLLVTVEP